MDLIFSMRHELISQADQKTKDSFKRFFREKVIYHGVSSANVSKIAKIYFEQIKTFKKADVFSLCEELFKSGYCEESWIAASWAYSVHEQYEPNDFSVFSNWIEKYIDNWAECDTLCNHAVGEFIEMFPEYLIELKKWTKSDNRWVKRASAVSLIIPAKEGKFLDDIFEIADSLLLDKDDMVQKGYGWMLKEASRKHQKEVFDYVIKNKAVMPRTALRYAIEKMPQDLRQQALKK